MAVRPNNRVVDQVLDPLGACLTPAVAARIAALRASPRLQARLDNLAKKNAKGRLTAREETEYDAYVEALDVLAILQAQARRALRGPRRSK